MKLITFDDGCVGRIEGDGVVELGVSDMRRYFELEGKVEPTGRELALADVRLRAPIAPGKFIHTTGNFREHAEEVKNANWAHALPPWLVFLQNVDAIVGPEEPIIYPEKLTKELDYELELAVIIGKAGKFISPEEAEDYIAGYVVFNDVTARDIQAEEAKYGNICMAKALDTFSPVGPWIVTPDEVGDVTNLDMSLRVNGETRQSSNSGNMAVTIPEIISHFSPMGYSAGDIMSTGTVAGCAVFSDDPLANYLKPGDVVEAEIENIGVLRNPVISWAEGHPDDA
jgi:2-keto-4-pentenoate hydratase/2-oxohepta-3-ene-1,7-dioic acid hydratase in catechol pathway